MHANAKFIRVEIEWMIIDVRMWLETENVGLQIRGRKTDIGERKGLPSARTS